MKANRALPLALAGAAVAQSGTSLTDVLASHDDISVLVELLGNNTSILEALQAASDITILAPSNDALNALLNSTAVAEAEDVESLVTAVLTYHVLNGTFYAANVTETPAFIPTLLENSMYENVAGAQVVEARATGTTVSFYSALKAQANVTEADIAFDGGVVHVINSVLSIPGKLTETAVEGGLSAVVGALETTEQAPTLEELENVTIFAPNNDAFAAIGSIVGELSTEDLSGILAYHVISGSVLYSSSLSNTSAETLGGGEVEVTVLDDGSVYVNAAKVVLADILIANGVVHVIDNVLNPNGTDTDNEPNPSTTQPAFPGASTASDGGVPLTSNVPEPTGAPEPTETATDGGAGQEAAAPRATAAMAMGALFGGAALLMNGV
jgi:uncharacterized surface protein with fasciclin (FAS1) repeats